MTSAQAPLTIPDIKAQCAEVSLHASVHAQIESIQEKQTKTGKPYYEYTLRDAAGAVTLKAWQDTAGFAAAQNLQPDDFVVVTGEWSTSQYGVECKDWSIHALGRDAIETLLAGTGELKEKQDRDWQCIIAYMDQIADPRLHAMAQRFLKDYGERFRRTAAARKNHHARRGGLVEHVAQMMLTTEKICEAYPRLNRDLLLVGVLFHDCGKLWENSFPETGFSMPFSLSGELLGHIPIGLEVANKIWRDIMEPELVAAWKDLTPTNEEVRLHLLHLIGSHHGTHEFGSPVLPRTPEAIALHHIDNIDAKLEMMFAGYETTPQIAPGIYDRVFPLPGHLVEPLKGFPKPAVEESKPEPEPEAGEVAKPSPAQTTEQDPPESRSTEGNGWLFGG